MLTFSNYDSVLHPSLKLNYFCKVGWKPEWKWIVAELKRAPKMIPQDVSTCWNSTFDMLDMALEYQEAVIAMTE